MACLGCGRGFHWECESRTSEEKCCCINDQQPTGAITPLAGFTEAVIKSKHGYKEDDDIGESAGRKRAAVLFEIVPDEPCEWRLLADCGGGQYPIIGCLTGKQENRHHGPDKKTSNNEEDNVHLICSNCHNTWHAKNDGFYDRDKFRLLKHSPRPATPEELLLRGKS
jgi:hypothetical protein